jgi:hypothetical protein
MSAFGNLPRLVVTLAFLLLPVACEAEQATAKKQYPPPGRLVDVGGYRVHINCAGTGGPTGDCLNQS